MNIPIRNIMDFLNRDILRVDGNFEGREIKYLKDPNNVDEHTLDWVNPIKANGQEIAECSKAKTIIVATNIVYTEKIKRQGKVLLFVANPKLIIAKVANHFFTPNLSKEIHLTAVIHPDVKIGSNASIGPHCVIGKCTIGENVEIHGNVCLYDNVVIGNDVEIHAGVVIGCEAHNFVEDKAGDKIKFPHLGNVIIGDHIIVGANSVVCRGVLSDTVIGNGTKIAQSVLIGANNKIGKNCAIRGGAKIAGSVRIQDGVIIGLGAMIREQLVIGESVMVGMGSVVTKDVPRGEVWIGNPAKNMR